MRIPCYMRKFISKNKENVSYEDFRHKFYFNLRLDGINYEEGQYDEILKKLYSKNKDEYAEWYNAFSHIKYGFVKENKELIITLIDSGNISDLLIAWQMVGMQKSLVYQNIPLIDYEDIKIMSSKKVLLKLEKELLLVQNKKGSSTLEKIKTEFKEKYYSCAYNPYLAELYNEILNAFDEELIDALNKKIKKVESKKVDNTYNALRDHDFTTAYVNIKNQKLPK